jgi:hypothetical protein
VAQALLDRGWTDARPLKGGLEAWRAARNAVGPKGAPAGGRGGPRQTVRSLEDVQRNLHMAEGDEGADAPAQG